MFRIILGIMVFAILMACSLPPRPEVDQSFTTARDGTLCLHKGFSFVHWDSSTGPVLREEPPDRPSVYRTMGFSALHQSFRVVEWGADPTLCPHAP